MFAHLDELQAATHVQQASNSNVTGTSFTSFTATFTSANTSGNAIIVGVTFGNSNPTITASDTQGNTYTQAVKTYDSGHRQGSAILYATNIKGGSANQVTVKFSTSVAYLAVGVHEYSGIASASASDVTAGNTGSGTSLSSSSATTTAGGDLIFGVGVEDSTGHGDTFTAGSGFTKRVDLGSAAAYADEDETQATAGAVAATWTLAPTGSWIAAMAAFKASGSGGTPPSITSLAPTSGPVGTSVTITGANFGTTQGTSTVKLNGVTATPTSWGASSITVTVPAGAGTGSVVVTVGGQASNGVNFTMNKIAPTVTWGTPAAITYGTALSATQLNATASTPGTFVYTPPSGTVLAAGSQTLSVTFTPTDTTDYTSATQTVTLTVNKVTPAITWAAPAAITYGTALSATQLNATASTPGTFVYTPPSGTVLTAGSQTLSATFTPTNTTDYTTATQTVMLTVNKAAPAITWATPAAINYGTALSAAQLNATANTPGIFVYTPPTGTVLTAGSQTLSMTFTPTDATDYTAASQTVTLTVNKAAPTISWPMPATITYGTALSATQLNATSSTPGVFVYTPSTGTVLSAGSQTLSVTFTPTDTTDYNSASQTVALTVNRATPAITWATPAAITYGMALNATQLNATASIPGMFVYTPPSGTVPSAGSQTLSVTFTPTDSTDYNSATQTVALTVNKATPTISWPTPAAITYGTALSATQLNATANTPGTFVYTPPTGTVLAAGSQTLSVTFTPSDSNDYTTATQTVTLAVNNATSTITWTTPTAITYGTALSSTQLNATANTPGTFVYTPPTGAVLAAGSQTLSVTFTPTDTTDYNSATQTVTLTVNKATPPITWATPVPITYGTALSSTQLNATANTPGTFVYTPPAGSVPTAGSQTLSVAFTPNDSNDYSTATQTVTLTVNQPPPVIANLSPVAGLVGTAITITGTGFGATQGGSTVTFNGVAATASSWSSTTIVATVPNGATTGNVVVTLAGVPSNAVSFSVIPSTPALVQHVSQSSTLGNAVTAYQIRLPNATRSGNCLIVGVSNAASGAIPTLTDDQGDVFTQIVSSNDGVRILTLFTALNIAAGAQNITVSFSSPTSYVSGLASEFRNIATVNAVDANQANTGTGTTVAAGTLTPAASGDLIYQFAVQDNISNPPGYFTQGSNPWSLLSADVMGGMAAQYQVQTAAAAIDPAMSISANNNWNSVAAALITAPSGSDIPGIHIVHLEHNAIAAGTVSPIPLEFPSSGNLVVVSWIGASGEDITGITDGNGNSYAQIGSPFGSGNSGDNQIFYAANAATSPGMTGPVLTTNGTTSSGATAQLFDITGAAVSPFDAIAGLQTASGNQTNPGNVTGASFAPTTASELVISSIAVASNTINVVSVGNFVASVGTPETSPWPADENSGWAVVNNTSATPMTFVWNTMGGPVGNWASIAAGFEAPVIQTTPAITWATPAAINYGTALSAVQLNATANVPGVFVYTPPAGAVLSAGTQTLSVTFTPTDTTDYTTATQTVTLVVNQAVPMISWAAPAAVSYGTALSAMQLDATASTPGMFVYTPAAGTVPAAGSQTLSVMFTPTDTTDYTPAMQTVVLTVSKVAPTITWTTPTAIVYGTALSATQLNAMANTPGTFVYTPPAGTVLGAGSQTLSLTFTPSDSNDYATATQAVMLTVNKETPAITWAAPSTIGYGTALSATQLNATASTPGTFVYTPSVGTILAAGPQTLSMTFTPTDSNDYTTATQTVALTVNKATPSITWATPAAITYGTALSSTQLNATANVPGVFVYTPAIGSVLTPGTQMLSVTFTPTDTADYTTVTQTVTLTVNKATPAITWATPVAITYGTALSSAQLNATANTPGTFVYTPPSGAVLAAGSQTLSVTFTPSDATDYNSATQTVTLTVNKATPAITWAMPGAISYGTALGAAQLNATANTPGTFVYTPPSGTVLAAGSQTLSVTFTPSDTSDYTGATQTVTLTVNKATPAITWATPTAITYGTALSATQLDATANTPGVFVYTPPVGTVLAQGSQTLSVTFTPTDSNDYTTGTQTVMITVNPPAPPMISNLSPNSGLVGTAITITGTSFGATQGASTVSFNGVAATASSWGSTTIVAAVPNGAATGNLVVTVGGQASNGVNFTVLFPTITSLSPTSGASGTSVTITGTNFGATQSNSTVTFNGTATTPTSWSATKVVAPVPLGATTGNVVVTVGSKASNGVNFTVPAPSITSLSPTSGASGTSVTITGTNFGATQGNSTVAFNGTATTPTSWSTTKVVAPVPSGATTGNVIIKVAGQASNGVNFTVPVPSITSLSPTSGPVGTAVTITGTNFGTTQGASTVTFNGVAATPTSWSSTKIVSPVPLGATTGNLVVTVGTASNGVVFTVSAPAITSLSPTSGPAGTTVTITGTSFGSTQGNSTVTFNGAAATPTSWSTTKIVVPVPLGAKTGNVVVTVGTASNGVTFTVIPPSITSLSPTSGPAGTAVTITGTNFGTTQGSSTVTFNGVGATPTSWSSTKIVAPVPLGAATGNVVVTVGTASNGVVFTVTVPSITSLSPAMGPVGTAVTITGTNFGATQGNSTVTFNGTPSTPTSWSATTIVVPVPLGATTGNVVVTVGGVATSGVNFTVTVPTITNLSPASGPAGTLVTITGSSFGAVQGTGTVTFNGMAAPVTNWSDTSVGASVPLGATSGNVVVTVAGQVSNGVGFTVLVPNITGLSPNSGPVGTPVTITGTSFGATQGTSTVSIGGTPATITSWSNTSIAAVVPPGAATGNVVVSVNSPALSLNSVMLFILNRQSGVAQPIANAAQCFGAPGQPITCPTGTTGNLLIVSYIGQPGDDLVSVKDNQGNNYVDSGQHGTSQQGGESYIFYAANAKPGVTSWTFTSSLNGNFDDASVYDVSNASANPLDNATSTSNNDETAFGPITGPSITASTPNGIIVMNLGITSNSITSVSAPFIFDPQDENNGWAHLINAQPGTFQPTWTANQQEQPGGVNWWGGIAAAFEAALESQPSNGVLFVVTVPPVISNVSPNSGPTGTPLTITGVNFGTAQGASTVTFNGVPATPTSWSNTSISVVVPSGATTGNVVVTTSTASNGVNFTVVPSLVGLSPSAGPAGIAVTITGTSFGAIQGTSTVAFNGTVAAPTSWSATSIVVPVPQGATSGNIVVTVGGASSNGLNFAVTSGITVSLSPKRGGITLSQSLEFTASLTNDVQNLGVTWTASGLACTGGLCGTFTAVMANTATYNPPASAGSYTITATSLADPTQSASATIGVTDLAGYFSWRGPEMDTTRQGVNPKEYALTTASVSSATFGKLFSCPLDGFAFAQPLYAANLTIGSVQHSVIFVATENDSLYAFDADDPTCKPIWATASVSLLPAGETAAKSSDANEVSMGPTIGVTGTPVIDPTTNTLYLVAVSETPVSAFIQRLHAIDITTGRDRIAPVIISASVPGTGTGSSGTPPMISFDPQRNNQRPGLLLLNGNVYVAWASHNDNPVYHGWVLVYSASTLAQVAALSSTPDGSSSGGMEGGIWMSGAAPSADANGSVYLAVGNGTFDDTSDTVPPVAPQDDFGDSVLKLNLSGNSLGVADFFAPDDQMNLDVGDVDLGSTGAVLLPDLTGNSPTQLMYCAGMDGNLYLLNRNALGQFTNSSNNIVQYFQLSGNTNKGFRSTPAFFNNTLYAAGSGDPLMAVPFIPATRQFSTTPSSQSGETYGGYGVAPMLSAQSTSNAIVWTIAYGPEQGTPSTPAILRAYDATNLASKLYDSSQQGTRDATDNAIKFTVPTVANGKVYVGTQTSIIVFGLLPN